MVAGWNILGLSAENTTSWQALAVVASKIAAPPDTTTLRACAVWSAAPFCGTTKASVINQPTMSSSSDSDSSSEDGAPSFSARPLVPSCGSGEAAPPLPRPV